MPSPCVSGLCRLLLVSANGRAVATVLFAPVVGVAPVPLAGLPAVHKALLALRQCDVAGAYQTFQRIYTASLALAPSGPSHSCSARLRGSVGVGAAPDSLQRIPVGLWCVIGYAASASSSKSNVKSKIIWIGCTGNRLSL
jgi:hypothetical protein